MLQVWLLHLLEYVSSTLSDLLVFPCLRISTVVICSQRCSFFACLCDKDSTFAYQLSQWHVLENVWGAGTYCGVPALLLRFAMNLPIIDLTENRATTNHLFLLCIDFIVVLRRPCFQRDFWSEVRTVLVLHSFVALGEVLADFQLPIS